MVCAPEPNVLSFYHKRKIKTKLEVFIMATESKNKKMRVKIFLAMAACLLVILGGMHSQVQAAAIVGWGQQVTL